MRRFIMEDLIRWKSSTNRKPLILRGARQVGKTWAMKELAKTFDNFYYLNLEKDKDVFLEGDVDPKKIIERIEIKFSTSLNENTLIIVDEIQEIRSAVTSLKYFQEEYSWLPVICAGSQLGILQHEKVSFPVGKVTFFDIFPLSFLEFLLAVGYPGFVKKLVDKNWLALESFHKELIDLLKIYYCTGGLPEVVQDYIDNGNLNNTREIQQNLLDLYYSDFSKHIPNNIVSKVRQVWQSIPAHLSKENKKFIWGAVREGARSKDYEDAIQWLIDLSLVYKVTNVNNAELPLSGFEQKNIFKIYLLDVGLLGAMSNLPIQVILQKNEIFEQFKGALTEQYVLQQLVAKNGIIPNYWTGGKSEVDFIFTDELKMIPLEVKAQENLKSQSLKSFYTKYGIYCYRTSLSFYKKQDWLTNIPLYGILAGF
ncbi:MAG: AAA family ATPase [Candidatus Ancillula sp.]|nr:AAA family ATPase [Candidatus Ancillula sp.]